MPLSQTALLDTQPLPLGTYNPPKSGAGPLDNRRPAKPLAEPPAQPATPDALWTLLHAARPDVEMAPHLGEALRMSGLIDRATLNRALELQGLSATHRLLGRILVDQGALSEAQLRMALAQWLGVRVIDPRDFSCEPEALKLISRTVAERESVLPLMLRGDVLVVLMAEPWDKALLAELRFITQRRVMVVMAVPGTLMPAIHRAYAGLLTHTANSQAEASRNGAAAMQALAGELQQAAGLADAREAEVVSESDNTLVRLINSIIHEAIHRRASDIHIETADAPRQVRVRLRVDGELVPLIELPPKLRFAVVARLKIMSDLDIAEHRKPQDGKIDFARFGGPHVELRMVTIPTSGGLEDVVLRLLSGLKPMPLDDIGLRRCERIHHARSFRPKTPTLRCKCSP